MPESLPPSGVPQSGGNTPYIAGVVVLGALIGGLVWWKSKDPPPPPAAPPPVATQEPPPIHMNAAPPPPPVIEEEPDAGADAASAKTAIKGAGPGPCSGKCVGESSPALNTALRSTAQSAQGCYNRALRGGEVSGSMTVSVQVGQNGSVCSASIGNDSVHSSEISACVLNRFRGKSFPAPQSGCVVVNIPISFAIKQ